MKICILRQDEAASEKGFQIFGPISFRSSAIYTAGVCEYRSKRKTRKNTKKLAAELIARGIRIATAPEGLFCKEVFSKKGIRISDYGAFFLRHIDKMAVAFAESIGGQKDFLISGGSCNDVVSVAVALLKHRRYVFLDCLNFDEISWIVAESTGACVYRHKGESCIKLDMCAADMKISDGSVFAKNDDFKIELPIPEFNNTKYNTAPLAEALEIFGVLRKNDIKIRYFPKEKAENENLYS